MQFRAAKFRGDVLTLQHTTFRVGDRLVFRDSCWQIKSGECWGVVGEMDSGRNLLIQGLCGELPPVEGELIYGYEELDPQFEGCPESGVAHVLFSDLQDEMGGAESFAQLRWNRNLQDSPLLVSEFLSQMEVEELYSLEEVPPRRRREYISFQSAVVELLGIQKLFTRELDVISNGERRKVFLARALLKDPMLLVLEHPYEGLDVHYRKELFRIFKQLMGLGLNLMFLAPETDLLPSFVKKLVLVEKEQLRFAGDKKTKGFQAQKKKSRTKKIDLPESWLSRLRPGRLTQAVVEMKKVNVQYGEAKILREVSWTIQPGECWALSGPNGAGKSTLLSLIQGDNPMAYANDVRLFGKSFGPGHSIWQVKKRIGSVSPEQHIYFHEELSVLDAVCTGFFDTLQLFENCGRVRRGIARDWLSCLGLQADANKSFSQLPVEEQRLVLIARALVRPIDLLILDEPCMGLSDHHRRGLVALIDAVIQASGCALIYVTHQKENLPDCITDTLHLKAGRVDRHSRRAKNKIG